MSKTPKTPKTPAPDTSTSPKNSTAKNSEANNSTAKTPKNYPERVHRRINKLGEDAVNAGLIQSFSRTDTGYEITLVGELLPKSYTVIFAGVFLINLLGKVNLSEQD